MEPRFALEDVKLSFVDLQCIVEKKKTLGRERGANRHSSNKDNTQTNLVNVH